MHDHIYDEVPSVYRCAVHTKYTLYTLHRLKKTANLELSFPVHKSMLGSTVPIITLAVHSQKKRAP